MDNADTEEVTLDMGAEPEPKPEPAKVEQAANAETEADPAAEAFARLEGEMALMRRAVQHLAAERADIVIPDYGKTLGGMVKRLDAISASLGDITEHPAMQMTPESFGARIEAVALAARRADQERIEQAHKDSSQATPGLSAALTEGRTADEQKRRLWQGMGGGVLAAILLWSFLPGTIARTVPESWHWPERMAARVTGESSRWDAGARLMQTDSPQAWSALVEAADLLRDNRDAIDACRKSASRSPQPVRCTVKIRARSR
ncbi:DUF6118 family protein [uncultured Sphingorhabdus sp.]|uniref:DUF6118 family protein n=1 Tax=uncultured Sphingorhabdus sp. TaxID=1686106 RepID=UPI002605D6CD|nr:DUF6118 family protein [uncultured Sphingorhabdus sp.]